MLSSQLSVWSDLQNHARSMRAVHMRQLFDADPQRFPHYTLEACDLFLDYSKHRVVEETISLLRRLAEERDLTGRRDGLFAGEAVNNTEGRAALHMALRNPPQEPMQALGQEVMPAVGEVLERIETFVGAVHGGQWLGYTGKPVSSVVNIGIGGSDLGPLMVSEALSGYRAPSLRGHFVSNIDARQIDEVLSELDPETTLFIVASKTFGTQETLTNARTARRWLVDHARDEGAVAKHFVAVSTSAERVREFGIDTSNMFGFWDWVGGRYSLWSAIGLSAALLVGMERFRELLEGAHAMDVHFRTAPMEQNMPVVLGLLGVWYSNFLDAQTHAVLPYDYGLRSLPAYLQQLEMESNGKRVTRDGEPLDYTTCPIVWGGPGNNGQHAFYQLLHQGTRLVPADFIVALESAADLAGHQDAVLANALAQTEALMRGRTEDEARSEMEGRGLPAEEIERIAPHRTMPGNQPSSTILYDRLTPRVLGSLIALYEHKVFVQSVCWGNNPFDQWGVELGKQLAQVIEPQLRGPSSGAEHDPSTQGLIEYIRAHRQ